MAKARKVYIEEQLQKNSYWLSRIERNYFLDLPRKMITPNDYLTGYYTPEVLQDRIQRYFNPENYMEIILYPKD